MEAYRNNLLRDIKEYGYDIENDKLFPSELKFIINRNEEGKLHSRYLGDRYEPALIGYSMGFKINIYLFNGEIRDCGHPVIIFYVQNELVSITYYSTERILNEKPINIIGKLNTYNCYYNDEIEMYVRILNELNAYYNNSDSFDSFSLLCDEMDEDKSTLKFKFAD